MKDYPSLRQHLTIACVSSLLALPLLLPSTTQPLLTYAINKCALTVTGYAGPGGDFGQTVTQQWRTLPPALVRQAIDELLRKAQSTESGSMEMRQSRRSTAVPRRRPASYQTRCPSADATRPSASSRLSTRCTAPS